ncbi:MAG: UDP-N-acetylmuramoyl-L-alanine--D-glutamate ligase [Candidatus Cloacimonetes bacterium]|nr:UDP-N-acetylmuramoyl-L-alanine--D-glutamate ligase [Candidatus Cloacimonadota bacterium]MBL7108098.1 UDP-N-acetylmuramoyl-L-alanine--D-glutamate ligase [Candidatus Cloacimonadota bacterium]
MEFRNKKIAILGIARSGLAAAKKIKKLGGTPFLSDKKSLDELNLDKTILDNFDIETNGHSKKILESNLIIISPGVPLDLKILMDAKKNGIPIWSELELGYQISKNTNAKIVAVTGSNGKSTVATLIYHILKKAGKKAILAGNIGQSFTSFPIENNIFDFIVLEVSSFQLDSIYEFSPDISIILNITPDHLDRYDNFNKYVESKSKIFENQTKNDVVILNYDDNICRDLKPKSNVNKEFYSLKKNIHQKIFVKNDKIIFNFSSDNKKKIYFRDIPLFGKHNISNIFASAIACLHCKISADEIIDGIKSFSALEHRLEFVAKIQEIPFINDSKSTNSSSVKVALKSFDSPINLIMGGSNKNENFSTLIPNMKKYVKNLILFGETKNILYETFTNYVNTIIVENLQDAVSKAFSSAKNGEYILLSPGCASFDMFENFEDRGKKFKKIVINLKKEKE